MFYGAKIKDDCFYFIKTLSENKSLVKFIEDMDSEPLAYSMMPKWEKDGHILKKEILKNKISSNSRVYQKCLYVINSIDSGIRYCLGLFCENSSFKSFKINKTILYMLNSKKSNNITEGLDSTDESIYYAYLFINNEPGKINVTFNKNGQALFLDEGSIFIVSNKEDITIEYLSDQPLYFSRSEVVLMQ
jgi:hypothetical protein